MNHNITDFEWIIASKIYWLEKDEASDQEFITYLKRLLNESRRITYVWDSSRFYGGEFPTHMIDNQEIDEDIAIAQEITHRLKSENVIEFPEGISLLELAKIDIKQARKDYVCYVSDKHKRISRGEQL